MESLMILNSEKIIVQKYFFQYLKLAQYHSSLKAMYIYFSTQFWLVLIKEENVF